jgi:hypothetical protein
LELGLLEECIATTPLLIDVRHSAQFKKLLRDHQGQLALAVLEWACLGGSVAVAPKIVADNGWLRPLPLHSQASMVRLAKQYASAFDLELLTAFVFLSPSLSRRTAYHRLAYVDNDDLRKLS